jgi:hypothetical protein
MNLIKDCTSLLSVCGSNSKSLVLKRLMPLCNLQVEYDALSKDDLIIYSGKICPVNIINGRKYIEAGCFGYISIENDNEELHFYKRDIKKGYRKIDDVYVPFEVTLC